MAHNPRIAKSLLILSVIALAFSSFTPAQTPSDTAQTIEDALHQMSDQAGVVFVGEVTAIRHHEGANGASGVVETEFLIDQAIRGCTSGSTYVLREWAGLWAGGDQRYRLGQRLLMLLHTPGATGISSPVGGMAGAIPIRGTSTAPHATDTSAAPQPTIADLRWVGTRLHRPIAYYDAPSAHQPILTAQTTTSTPTQSDISDTSLPAQQATVDVVVNMLTSWQKAQHAAP